MKKLILLFLFCSCSHRPADTLISIHLQDRTGISEIISDEERLERYEGVDFATRQPYKRALRLFRSEEGTMGILTTYYPNGQLSEWVESRGHQAQGPYRAYYPSGALKAEAVLIGGQPDLTAGAISSWLFDGSSHAFYEDGSLQAVIAYKKGMLDGESLYYSPAGVLVKKVEYEKNEKVGPSLAYHDNGVLSEELCYAHNCLDGKQKRFHPDGTLLSVEEYDRGRLMEGSYFFPHAELASKIVGGEGIFSCFTYRGELEKRAHYRKGVPEGLIEEFVDGKLALQFSLFKGKKEGEEIHFFPHGQKKLSIPWVHDRIHGAVLTWYEEGGLQSRHVYAQNEKTGPLTAWYRDGSLCLEEEYTKGILQKGKYYERGNAVPVSSIHRGEGVATLFDGDGLFIQKVVYEEGRPSPLR